MQEPFTPTLEQVVKNTDAYLFVLRISLLLATPIVQVIQTLLVLRARVIVLLLRMQTGQHGATMITSARSMDAIISTHAHRPALTTSARTQPHSHNQGGPSDHSRSAHDSPNGEYRSRDLCH